MEPGLTERLLWLIRLRWGAVAGILLLVSVANYLFKIPVQIIPFYVGNGIILAYNTLFYLHYRHLATLKARTQRYVKATAQANLQIALDLIMLTILIHYSGGIENPFHFYYIFHVVIASILLSNRAAFLQATLAVLMWSFTVYGEYTGLFTHYHLAIYPPQAECLLSGWYVISMLFVLVSAIYIMVYFTTSIVNKLRQKENTLAAANEQLAEQDRLKSQYIQTVSHDLQSSLSTIQSCLNVVLGNMTGAISDKSREMVARAEQRSTFLLQFVKDLLNLSRIRALKKLEKQDLDITALVEHTVQQWTPKARDKKIQVQLKNHTAPLLIVANPDAMEQLFNNLLENAVKYTPWGGKINITCTLLNSGRTTRVMVADTGIGIPEKELPHIFEDFFRARNATQMEKDGTGFGLSIVKREHFYLYPAG
jgi:signal transduction histidine kinase